MVMSEKDNKNLDSLIWSLTRPLPDDRTPSEHHKVALRQAELDSAHRFLHHLDEKAHSLTSPASVQG